MTTNNQTYRTSDDFFAELAKTYDDIRVLNTTGGGGVIYSGYHKRLNRRVVLKQIRAEHLDAIGSRRELDLLLDLKHTYLPQIFDFWEYANDVYTVMEFIEGKSLKEHLDAGRVFSEREVTRFAIQLAEVLAYLHNSPSHIVHADIKPANIMLTPGDNICLIDFNVSATGDGAEDTIGYTPGYAPPEQLYAFVRCKQANHARASAQPVESIAAAPAANAEDDRTALLYRDNDPDKTYLDEDARTCLSAASADHDRTALSGTAAVAPPTASAALTQRTATLRTETLRIGKPGSLFSQLEDTADRIEVHFGKKRRITVDMRTDIYSACATLYHLLTGRRPLAADTAAKQIPIEALCPRVNDAFADILEKGMAFDPDKRFSSSDQLLAALHKLAKSSRRYKRMRLGQDLTVLLLVAVFGLGLVSALRGGMMLLDTRTEAILSEADTYNRTGQYALVAPYITEQLLDSPFLALCADTTLGDAYYLCGTAALSGGDAAQAVSYLRTALLYRSDNPNFYRDYAIALARIGDTDGAAEALAQADTLGLTGANLDAVRGEILYAGGQYEDAGAAYRACLAVMDESTAADLSPDDLTTLVHALIGQDNILAPDGETTAVLRERITALGAGIAWFSEDSTTASYANVLHERLAGIALTLGMQYKEAGDTNGATHAILQAADSYRVLVDGGFATLNEYLNLSVCYQSTGFLDEAREVLRSAEVRYSDRYALSMRTALLAYDIAMQYPPEERDFSEVRTYGERAVTLYNTRTDAAEDPEMVYLTRILAELS